MLVSPKRSQIRDGIIKLSCTFQNMEKSTIVLIHSSDVVGEHAEIDVSVYDRTHQEAFLGHVRFCPTLKEYEVPYDGWFDLEPRDAGEQGTVTGQIRLKISFQKTD